MDAIIEQLKEYCDCFDDDFEEGDELFAKTVEELITIVSMMTCWTQEPCETFLKEARTEIFDAERICGCTCDNGMLEFEPYFIPFFPESITAQLVIQQGVSDEIIDIESEDIGYSETFGQVRINYQKYFSGNVGCNCVCPDNTKLRIQYIAGYDAIPDCLLPVFCDLLHIIQAKNDCGCDKCQSCVRDYVDNDPDLNEIPEGNNYTDINLAKTLSKLVETTYENTLGLISLCGRNCLNIWGVRV